MRHEISVLLYNIPCYTKEEIRQMLLQAECNIDAEFDIFMMSDYIKIEFTRYANSQDSALIDILEDLEFMDLRKLLSTIEMDVYK